LALWPLAAHAATAFVAESTNGIDAPAQVGLVVTKSASPLQTAVGSPINFTFRITNTGSVALTTITAVDSLLGTVGALSGPLAAGASRSATISFVVPQGTPDGLLVSSVTVTGSDAAGNSTTASASTTVLITAPTSLPEKQQPNQPRTLLFLPMVEP
jgi:uncharacterized repeat protein (TIGR01451 family)